MSDLQDMRQIEVRDRYQDHLTDLKVHQLHTQITPSPLRLMAAHTLRTLADLIEGKARVMVVYPEQHFKAS
ncbi:hypothetical protein [Deinococcus cellulosilyticus]|uniref:Uncharacterized protein n=1 Tax=Deinococcus cellulosilyticus (strain DSM 18568 / NBRC 106333 / KACC 11606 / 5516J-15) TaxID=1223518 RepID=A0A511MZ07_DEIC1|nr:hypothetical protein [Deinococcus cellulosilyticus]GEM45850.1 hypothetical protein DC3_14850 [Deinococcus cellulosilyticus NBRC 106333 = KACC 11606]